jgi:UTP--glucose-1-phosphate uridylyltransferase
MKIKTAIIPVAGRGTRMLPATKEIPKELIPIIDRPMIQYVVEEAVASGIENIVFVTSPGKHQILDYFSRNKSLETFLLENGKSEQAEQMKLLGEMINVSSVIQKEQLGLGHAILCAKKMISDEAFAVLLGDDLVFGKPPVTKQLIDNFTKFGNPVIGVMEVPAIEINKYGIVLGPEVSTKTVKIERMIEKPAVGSVSSRLATPGRYVLTREIFDHLETIKRGAGGEYQLTDAINQMASTRDVYAYSFEGDRFDTGNLQSYIDSFIGIGLQREDTKEFFRKVLKKYSI